MTLRSATWILYRRELRSALREKSIVVNSILIPILLYPVLLWAAFTGLTFVAGRMDEFVGRVALVDSVPAHSGLRRALARGEHLELIDVAGGAERALEMIRRGTLDALVEVVPPSPEAHGPADNFALCVTLDTSKDRSRAAGKRITEVLDRFRHQWLEREARQAGIAPASWRVFALEERNVASGRQMGAFLLGLMLPLFFVIMVAVGCFYPAVDATAGERERSTWETLMSVAAPRAAIVAAKYLYVATFGCLAGLLNLAAMTLTIQPVLKPLLERAGETVQFAVPLASVPVLAAGAVLLAGFVAAGMMLFASFARTYKEGQSMITPFYILVLVPVMFLQVPGLRLSLGLAVVPVVNVTLMVREAISGSFQPAEIVVTTVASIALIVGCLALAGVILRSEDVVTGSYGGSLAAFVRERLIGRRAGRGRA
ncbi:MAG: ABC transporter permease [Acidobacteriota bacterium]